MSESKELKLNVAQQLVINELAKSLRGIYGGGSLDAKHSMAWSDYGYKDILCFSDHYRMYRRFGIAKAGIKIPPSHCWKTKPKILQGDESDVDDGSEGNTDFEVTVKRLFKKLKLWKKLKLVDEYQRVGSYGAFVVQIRGNGRQIDWSEPLDSITAENIVKFIPLYQDQLKPSQWESNPKSERYGQPITYNFDEANLPADGDLVEQKNRSVTVHHSRVIIFAEGADDDSIYGEPANEAGFNDLITMEKIIGAGGEGFWKNASMKTAFSAPKDSRGLDPSQVDAIDEAITDFMEGMDKHLILGALDSKVLSTELDDPKEHFIIALQSYSASVEIASKILVGSQEGRLAADQDGKFTLSTFQSRREDWCSDMITNVIDWLIDHRVLDDVEYFVRWDDLLAPSDAEKFELGSKLTEVITKLVEKIGYTPIDPNEVAKIMGYTPLELDSEQGEADFEVEETDVDEQDDAESV